MPPKETMTKRWGVIVALAVLSFLSGGWLMQRGAHSTRDTLTEARLFDEVRARVRSAYVDSIPEGELYRRATRGMLEELRDPYSVLLVGDDYRDLTEKTSGNYAGLGIQIDVRDGGIMVVAPLPDTPAERAGIESGDIIVSVEGKSTQGWTNDQALKALRGQADTKVTIAVRREGVSEPIKYTLTRAVIHIRSVPQGTMFDHSIGYIALTSVSETSFDELRDEIAAMRKKGMKALVLDLRNNPGGLLEQGVQVTDLFLDPKQQIVATRGRAPGSTRAFDDRAPQLYPDLPIVVLVNEFSASAAEIIAGAMQDHDRALVVGTPTFGKGLVQSLFTIDDSTALKLTTAKWYTPSGRSIQREARNEEDQLLQALGDGSAARTPALDSARARDTSVAARPIFKTDAGREVRGGGGIVPDVIVRRDTLTSGERAFAETLGEKASVYRDVITSYALQLKTAKAVTSESFSVTPAMLQEVYRQLSARGVKLTPKQFEQGNQLVRDQLGYELARYVFGRPGEFRRRSKDDPQVGKAVELLSRAQTPKDLLSLATVAPAPAK